MPDFNLPDYVIAIFNLIVINFLISLLVKKHSVQLLLVISYYVGINLIFHYYNQVNRPDYYYLIEFILVCVASYQIHKVCDIFKTSISNASPYIKVGSVFFANDKRIYILFTLLIAVLAITSTFGLLKFHHIDLVSNEFYTSWSVDVLFFIMIGFSITYISLRLPHLEDFSTRVGILFSGTNLDQSIKSPALSDMESDIKTLGLMITKSHRQITVIKYSKKYEAYKIQVTTSTTLVSMFGDVDAVDDMNFVINPDDFSTQEKKPNPIGQIISLLIEKRGETLKKPVKIFQNGSHKINQDFTAGTEPRSFTLKYWCWVKTNEALAYRFKRFCKKHTVTIVNRMKKSKYSKVKLTVHLDSMNNKTSKQNIITLTYGNRWETDYNDLSRGERQEICSLLPPKKRYR